MAKTAKHIWAAKIVTLKITQWKLLYSKNRNKTFEEKRTESKGPIGPIKLTNIWILGDPQGEEKKKGTEKKSEEIMTRKFPKLMKYMNINIQEAQWTPGRINQRHPNQNCQNTKWEVWNQQEKSNLSHTKNPQ